MNLSELNGFGRINTNGSKQPKAMSYKRNSKANTNTSRNPKTKSVQATTARQRKKASRNNYMNGTPQERAEAGTNSAIGFSNVFRGNAPKSAVQGYGRVTYSNRELQGLSLQGIQILQGYSKGSIEDIEDWDYLLSMEHPDTLQGFPSWVLNGKAERQARQAKRRAERLAKQARQAENKLRRKNRRQEAQDLRDKKKALRVAKKEERLLKKQSRREEREKDKEARRLRKAQRIEDRRKNRADRQETRRLKREGGGGFLPDFLEDTMPFVEDFISSDGDFDEFTYSSFDDGEMPTDAFDFISQQRNLPSEDVLFTRDSALEFMPELPEDEFILDDDEKKESNIMIPLLLAGGIALAMTQGKNKKRK